MNANGGPRNSTPGTLTKLFFDAIEKHDKPNAFQVKRNGAYTPISSREFANRVRQVALGLQELGIKRGERVAILSENRPEWAIADYATLTSGLTNAVGQLARGDRLVRSILLDLQRVRLVVLLDRVEEQLDERAGLRVSRSSTLLHLVLRITRTWARR